MHGLIKPTRENLSPNLLHKFTTLIFILTFSLAALYPLNQAKSAEKDRVPNIVLIFIDDMGYGDIGPFGNKVNKTPNLDRMAREGNVLRQFYVANTACTPSRSALLTGSYAHRIGMDGSVIFPGENRGLNPAEITIAEMLKTKQYATGCFGKWHLGDQPKFLPLAQGFDEFFGIPYSNDMWSESTKQNPITKEPYTPLPVIKQNDVVAWVADGTDQSLLCNVTTEHAIKFIEDHRDEPFFCYIPHIYVHHPWYARPDVVEDAGDDLARVVVEKIDASVGQILDKLRELTLDRNTLVVFTSDNGPAHGLSAGRLRGRKAGPKYEGHMRVPTLTWWPGQIPAGSQTKQIAVTTDLLPTLAKLAGAEVPQDRVIDGKDVSDILLGKPNAVSPHKLHYYEDEGIRRGKWKLVRVDGENQLFDLAKDPSEKKNIAESNPKLLAELSSLLDKHAAEIAANTRPAGFVQSTIVRPLMSEPGDLPKLRQYMEVADFEVVGEGARKRNNQAGNAKWSAAVAERVRCSEDNEQEVRPSTRLMTSCCSSGHNPSCNGRSKPASRDENRPRLFSPSGRDLIPRPAVEFAVFKGYASHNRQR